MKRETAEPTTGDWNESKIRYTEAAIIWSVSDLRYRDSAGLLSSPIWLLADSRPRRVVTHEPLDPRHPTRHAIWTPILDHVQGRIFAECARRLDTSNFYIRNAVECADDKKVRPVVDQAVLRFREMAISNRPMMILCFGQFAFELARRACDQTSSADELWGKWSVEGLGREFHRRITKISPEETTALPLLHAIVARRFEDCHA
jgi:hypothetical protein